MKISYEEFLRDREEMPVFAESIFYPEVERRELGITDKEMENIVEYFNWHINQINKRKEKQKLLELLKQRPRQLILQEKIELERDLEGLRNFSK